MATSAEMLGESATLEPGHDLDQVAEEDPGPHAELEEDFFSRPPPPVTQEVEHFEPHHLSTMSEGQRLAMMVTAAMVGIGLVAGLGFISFGDSFIVEPAELGGAAEPMEVAMAPVEAPPLPQPVEVPKAAPAVVAAPSVPAEEPEALAEAEAVVESEAAPDTEATAAAIAGSQDTEQPVGQIAADTAASEPEPVAAAPSAVKRAVRRPSSSNSQGSPAFRRALARARRAFDRGDASTAQRNALDAIAIDPTRGYAYVLLAAARDALGNHPGAAAAYRRCLNQATDAQRAACQTLSR